MSTTKLEKKIPKALVLTNHMADFAGSELVAMEVSEVLHEMGYQVTMHCNFLAAPAMDAISDQVAVCDDEDFPNPFLFDIVWSQHHLIVLAIAQHPVPERWSTRFISAHLSPFEPFESTGIAVAQFLGSIVVANSRETAERLGELGVDAGTIKISHNACPDSFWVATAAIKRHLKNIVLISNHPPAEIMGAVEILKERGLAVRHLGISGEYRRLMPADLKDVDAVITIGKTVQCAIMAGVPVYCYDHFGGPGWIKEDNFSTAEDFNFSGRCSGRKIPAPMIAKEILDGHRSAANYIFFKRDELREKYSLRSQIGSLIVAPSNPQPTPEVRRLCEARLKLEVDFSRLIRRTYRGERLAMQHSRNIDAQAKDRLAIADHEIALAKDSARKISIELKESEDINALTKNRLAIVEHELASTKDNARKVSVELGGDVRKISEALKSATKRAELAELQIEKNKLAAGAQLSEKDANIKRFEFERSVVFNSLSWRLMAPARHLSRALALGKVIRSIYRIVRQSLPKGSVPVDFSSAAYLQLNPDVALAGIGPVDHYLRYGRREGRQYRPSLNEVASSSDRADGLPQDFEGVVYLEINPDVKKAGLDPERHFLESGLREGRSYRYPELDVLPGSGFDRERPTILVVSHDASRTGAPILCLNLVGAFAKKYNVISLILGAGELVEQFRSAGAVAIPDFNARKSRMLAARTIETICAQHQILFAIINSVESRAVLPYLAARSVPAVSLLHEFASYTRPRAAFRDAFHWSMETVFSATLTLENAKDQYPDLQDLRGIVLPQGKCVIPDAEVKNVSAALDRSALLRILRPENQDADVLVVLGAGAIQLRKGVDLFIECASRVISALGKSKCRFVWIGHGYNPQEDTAYSVYLADQLKRADLRENVFFVPETSHLEAAYDAADLFLLSSRLDPLPNVAIDAMCSGLPVVCFDKATGIADFLADSGMREHCVANYLDTWDIAQKIIKLGNKEALKEIGSQCQTVASHKFNMLRYVDKIEEIALTAVARMERENQDIKLIQSSGKFDASFFLGPDRGEISEADAIREYVRGWASGALRRKPCPGFNPEIYRKFRDIAEAETEVDGDEFADYLRKGEPTGPWRAISIRPGAFVDGRANIKVALHIHAYYPEMLPNIVERLRGNTIRPHLFISVKDEDALNQARRGLLEYDEELVEIRIVPNKGRDIGPLLTEFGQELVQEYEIIGHVHTKKSNDLNSPAMVAAWNDFLMENLLGGSTARNMADVVISAMMADDGIGVAFPDDPHVVGWSANKTKAEEIAPRLQLKTLPEEFDFPVGTMFWARASLLRRFVSAGFLWDDYPDEPLPYDGSMLHALERLFGIAANVDGAKSASIYVPGLTR
jgi:glycosyltransferase involved in cell wall biosynthesis